MHLLVNVKLLYQDARCNDKDFLSCFYLFLLGYSPFQYQICSLFLHSYILLVFLFPVTHSCSYMGTVCSTVNIFTLLAQPT